MENRYSKFTTLISDIYRSINKIKEMFASKFGIKAKHISCLFYMYDKERLTGDGMTATELCDISGEDKGAMSRYIKELTSMGYIKEDINKKKKYNTKNYLTESGTKVASCIFDFTERYVNIGGKNMNKEQRDNFYKNLEQILINLQDDIRKNTLEVNNNEN